MIGTASKQVLGLLDLDKLRRPNDHRSRRVEPLPVCVTDDLVLHVCARHAQARKEPVRTTRAVRHDSDDADYRARSPRLFGNRERRPPFVPRQRAAPASGTSEALKEVVLG